MSIWKKSIVGSTRSVRFMMAFLREGFDETDGGFARCAHDEVPGRFWTLCGGRPEPIGGGGAVGDRRAHVSALVPALRGGWRSRPFGPAAGQAVSQAGAGGAGRGGRAALPGALRGVHRQALPRAPGEEPRLRLGLYLDQDLSPGPRLSHEGAAAWRAPAQACAQSVARDDAAPGRLAASLDSRP